MHQIYKYTDGSKRIDPADPVTWPTDRGGSGIECQPIYANDSARLEGPRIPLY